MDAFWLMLLDLVVLLGAAMVLGTLCERLRQSAILGYMLAGVLAGPHVLNLVHNERAVDAIAELGVALLLFTIGLEFSWSRLRTLGPRAAVAGAVQIGVTLGVAAAPAWGLGWSGRASVALGAVAALSSTEVVLSVLAQRAEIDSVHGRFDLGILLVQDAAVVPLVLLVSALGRGGGLGTVASGTAWSLLIVGGFVVACYLISRFVLPTVLHLGTGSSNREIPILFAIVAAVGSAWVAHRLGFSPALGAFIAAIFLGESVMATQLRGDVGPLKTVFVTLFFSSIGMFADPVWIASNAGPVAAAVAGVALVKPAVVYGVARAFALPHRHAVAAGVCMGQVGVFSFVLARVGRETAEAPGVFDADTFSLIVSATILTLFLTPYQVHSAPAVGAAVERWLRRRGWVKRGAPEGATKESEALSGHVVIVGFGPAGRAVAEPLTRAKTPALVVDLNARSVLDAKAMGLSGVVGDAASPALLEQARLPQARAVVVTVPDHRMAAQVIREVRGLCPGVLIVARARYHAFVPELEAAGAHEVVDEEQTVGRTLSDVLTKAL